VPLLICEIAYVHLLARGVVLFLSLIYLDIGRLDLFLMHTLNMLASWLQQGFELRVILLDLLSVPFEEGVRGFLLRAALTLDLIPVLRGETALRVSLLGLAGWRLESEDPFQSILLEVD
jgi:hypothetical protein